MPEFTFSCHQDGRSTGWAFITSSLPVVSQSASVPPSEGCGGTLSAGTTLRPPTGRHPIFTRLRSLCLPWLPTSRLSFYSLNTPNAPEQDSRLPSTNSWVMSLSCLDLTQALNHSFYWGDPNLLLRFLQGYALWLLHATVAWYLAYSGLASICCLKG